MYKIRTNALPHPMHSAAAASSDAEKRQQKYAQQRKDQQRDGEGRQPRNEQHSQDDRKAEAPNRIVLVSPHVTLSVNATSFTVRTTIPMINNVRIP